MRSHRLAAEAAALAQNQGQRQSGGPGVDVHRGTAGEVDGRQVVGDPAADVADRPVVLGDCEVEDPVRDREVHDRGPDPGEDHPGTELRSIGDRAGDQGDGDDREDGLEPDEGHRGQSTFLAGLVFHQTLEAEVLKWIAEKSRPDIVSEGHRVAV